MNSNGTNRYAYFNDIIIDAGSLFFDIQVKQGQYISDILADNGMESLSVCVVIPFFNGGSFDTLHTESVSYDDERDMVVVSVTERDTLLMWDEIDTVSQNEILQAIHLRLTSEMNYEIMRAEDQANLA